MAAAAPIPPFTLQVGENIFGPFSANKNYSEITGAFDITQMSAPFDFYVEWSDDGIAWHLHWHDRAEGRGRNKDGSLATQYRFQLSLGAIMTSTVQLRARFVSEGAWHSGGGSLDWILA